MVNLQERLRQRRQVDVVSLKAVSGFHYYVALPGRLRATAPIQVDVVPMTALVGCVYWGLSVHTRYIIQ